VARNPAEQSGASGTLRRRTLLLAGLAGAVAVTLDHPARPSMPAGPVLTAAGLHAATSVNQHFDYADTAYFDRMHSRRDPSAAERAIDLGVRCVRTVIPSEDLLGWRAPFMQRGLQRLLEAGFEVHVRIPDKGDYRAALAFAKSFFGRQIRFFEGFNEPYRFSSSDAAYAGQKEWWRLLRADSFWDDVPLISPSDRPSVYFDPEARPRAVAIQQGANLHSYAGGRPPEQALAANMAPWQATLGPDVPLYVTEFGWHTAINNGNFAHHGVSGDPDQAFCLDADGQPRAYPPRSDGLSVQAAYLLRGLLENFRSGVRVSAIYELQNQKPVDNTNLDSGVPAVRAGYRDMEQHFGLVAVDSGDAAWTTRRLPSYDALRRFQRRLADEGPGTAPSAWPVRVTAPDSVRQLPLVRRDGSLDLALWTTAALQGDPTYSPRDGTVRSGQYTVVRRSRSQGIGDARHRPGHVYPAGSTAHNGDQDVETAKYRNAVIGAHLYPAPVAATVRIGRPCSVAAFYPCRSDAVIDIPFTPTLHWPVAADPVLLRFTPR